MWGAAFVDLNRRLTVARARRYKSLKFPACAKFAEVALVVIGTALTAYLPAIIFGKGSPWCRNLDNPNPHGVDKKYASRFQCSHNQYNELASLTLKPLAMSIASLFHQKSMHTFSVPALAYFFAYASFWTCVTYGLHVPSGLFIPSILCGATMGRLVAVLAFPLLFPHDTMQNLGQQTAIYLRLTFSRRLQDAISCHRWWYGRTRCHYSHDGRSCS